MNGEAGTIPSLRAAAVDCPAGPEATPGLWIRSNDVRRITRRGFRFVRSLTGYRRPVPTSARNKIGRELWHPLAEVLARIAAPLPRRAWTPEEDQYITEKLGLLELPTIAAHLGRTVRAVRYRMYMVLGVRKIAQSESNLRMLRTRELAGMLRRHPGTIEAWARRRGLPHRALSRGRGDYLYDLSEVRRWLADPAQHEQWVRLRPTVHKLLRLTWPDVEQLRSQNTLKAPDAAPTTPDLCPTMGFSRRRTSAAAESPHNSTRPARTMRRQQAGATPTSCTRGVA